MRSYARSDDLIAKDRGCFCGAPRTLLEELAKSNSGDVVLPTQTKQGQHNAAVRLRGVTEPDAAQKVLHHRLGINLPRRLRRVDEVARMEWNNRPTTEPKSLFHRPTKPPTA